MSTCSTTDWPPGLRNCIQSAKRVDRPGGARIQDVAVGPAYVQPITDDQPTIFDVEFRFTRDEARAFDAWVHLNQHNLMLPEFNMPIRIPDTDADTQLVRWVSRPPQRVAQAGNVYTYTGQILIRNVESADLDCGDATLAIAITNDYRNLDHAKECLDLAVNVSAPGN